MYVHCSEWDAEGQEDSHSLPQVSIWDASQELCGQNNVKSWKPCLVNVSCLHSGCYYLVKTQFLYISRILPALIQINSLAEVKAWGKRTEADGAPSSGCGFKTNINDRELL